MYTYFISYWFKTGTEQGFGNYVIDTTLKIKNEKDIQLIAADVISEACLEGTKLVILNFKRIKK